MFAEGPEPGSAANAAGVAVFRGQHRGGGFSAENELGDAPWKVCIQARNLGDASTQDDDIGVQHVDDLREAAGEPVFIALEGGKSSGFVGGAGNNFGGVKSEI